MHEILLLPVLLYGSKTVIWREKEKSRIRAEQMDNLRVVDERMRTNTIAKRVCVGERMGNRFVG